MLLLIDNYDSFTYNLYHYLAQLGAQVQVVRNDKITAAQALALKPKHIVLSPGPCTPNEAGVCLDLVSAARDEAIPLLGVCLGHQSIGQAFGGQVVRAKQLMHGKVDHIQHNGQGLFQGLEQNLQVTRYHSLIVDKPSLPACFEITATSDQGSVIQAFAHKELPIYGVQFHPESIATVGGKEMLSNFLRG